VARARKLPRPIFLQGRGSYLLDYYRVLPYLPLESLDGIAVTFSFIVPSLTELNWDASFHLCQCALDFTRTDDEFVAL